MRHTLTLLTALLLAPLATLHAAPSANAHIVMASEAGAKLDSDVTKGGGTSAGVGAAIAAGRAGVQVLLVEDSPMLGGMLFCVAMTNIFGPGASSGIFEEFRLRCRDYYHKNCPNDPALKAFPMVQEGYRYEPHVADAIFKQMVAELLTVHVEYHRYVTEVIKEGERVVGVVTRATDDTREKTYRAAVTIDATHEGDIVALAGAEFRLGREARSAEERYAGEIYMPHSGELFGSGRADGKIQAMAMIMTIKDYGPGADRTVPRPPHYNPARYAPEAMSDTRWFGGTQLPNAKYIANENMDGTDVADDGFEERDVNRRYILGNRGERRKIWERYRDYTLGYLYFRQTVMNPDAPATRLQLAGWASAAIGTTEGKRGLLQRELAAGSATFTPAELADFIVNLTNVGSA
jgi:ribulose 1,5-bisphosphate synthetase/thiazole synthase